MTTATRAAPRAETVDWELELRRVLGRPELVRPVFQPLVDLQRGVVCGWEMLARFDSQIDAPPPAWFAAAANHGVADALEALLIEAGLSVHSTLPPNTFLAVNVTPAALTTSMVAAAFRSAGSLGGLIVEITEQAAVDNYESVGRVLDELRARGAAVAVDDAGAGYASLSHIVALRPQFVKLDRALVTDLDRDEAKVAVVEAIGTFANRIDAWIVAEGVERVGELDALVRLGVPLAQGYVLARPERRMGDIDSSIAARIRERCLARDRSSIRVLAEHVPPIDSSASPLEVARRFADDPSLTHLPVVNRRGRPLLLRAKDDAPFTNGEATVLRVDTESSPADAARRAMTRRDQSRFDPLVLCDAAGRYLGLIRIERLIDELASQADLSSNKGVSRP